MSKKRVMYVRTNGYDMIVSYDPEEKYARYTTDIDVSPLLGHLNDIEDDTSWEIEEDIEDIEEWLGIDYSDSETPRILEEIKLEL